MNPGDDDSDVEEGPGSPACYLHELGPDGQPGFDRVQAKDVARWRKAERERLIAVRMSLAQDDRAARTLAIIRELERLIPAGPDRIVSVYWPIRGEPDLREWMRSRCERGGRVALPVAIALGQPLEFREWRPHEPMVRGLWKIPYPANGAVVIPTVVLAPVVGFDGDCYRLGYGGGFLDRTLARLSPKPLTIGLGYSEAAIPTIFPQPHDIPMDWVVTGTEASRRREPCSGAGKQR